jgi:hypothetical protein
LIEFAPPRQLNRSTAFCLNKANLIMAKQMIPKFISLGALGLLVIIFGFILFVLAAPLFVRMFVPNMGGVVFSVSRRAFTIALVAFLTVVVAALGFFARAVRRRLN